MRVFANLADAGHALAPLVTARVEAWNAPLLLPVLPNGVPVLLGMRESIDLPVHPLHALRSDDGVVIEVGSDVRDRTAIVIDDGVETGTVARAAAHALRDASVARLVLAVPVCSREASAQLDLLYDEVIAVERPLVRRHLAWHFTVFDTVDEAEALRLLARAGGMGAASS